jgi:predicted acyl esterase
VDAWLSQPLDGAFYQERNPDSSRLVVPLLCVGNWDGWSEKGYVAAASKAKWLRIETGDHLTPFYSEESLVVQKRFFDHFLKGQKNGWESEASVTLQVRRPDGANWQKAAAWPLPETQAERYYLDAGDGGMSPAKSNVSADEKPWEKVRPSRRSPLRRMSTLRAQRWPNSGFGPAHLTWISLPPCGSSILKDAILRS